MALGAEITNFGNRVGAQLALEVQFVLDDVRRAAIGIVGQPLRSNHADERWSGDSTHVEGAPCERIFERQVVIAGGAGNAPLNVATHVESRIPAILDVENSCSGAHGPLRAGAPSNTEARSDILIIRLNKPVSQTAVSSDADRRVEAGDCILIEIAASDADITRVQVWLAAEARRDPYVHQAAAFVRPGRRELVAQTGVDGEVGPQFPVIVDVISLTGGAELADAQASRVLRPGDIAKHVIGEAVTARRVIDRQNTAGILLADLIEAVAAYLGAELYGVPSVGPGNVVDPLEGVVVDHKGAIHVVTETAEAQDAHPWRAPGHGRRIDEAHTELFDRIPLVLQLIGVIIVEAAVAKTEFIYQGWREQTSVGEHRLLDGHSQGVAVQHERGLHLHFVLPAITAEPVGLGAFCKVDALRELILISNVI